MDCPLRLMVQCSCASPDVSRLRYSLAPGARSHHGRRHRFRSCARRTCLATLHDHGPPLEARAFSKPAAQPTGLFGLEGPSRLDGATPLLAFPPWTLGLAGGEPLALRLQEYGASSFVPCFIGRLTGRVLHGASSFAPCLVLLFLSDPARGRALRLACQAPDVLCDFLSDPPDAHQVRRLGEVFGTSCATQVVQTQGELLRPQRVAIQFIKVFATSSLALGFLGFSAAMIHRGRRILQRFLAQCQACTFFLRQAG